MQIQNKTLAMTAHAKALQQANQFEPAKKLYLQILKMEPNNADVLHLLAILYQQMKDYDAAIKLFLKVKKNHTEFSSVIPQSGACLS